MKPTAARWRRPGEARCWVSNLVHELDLTPGSDAEMPEIRRYSRASGLDGGRRHHRDSRSKTARPRTVTIEHPTVYQTAM
jgi:hypothetical protein